MTEFSTQSKEFTGRHGRIDDDPHQEGHSYKDQRADSRVKFLEKKMMARTRDFEERMGQKAGLMWSRTGFIECRLKNLEFKMEEHHDEIMAMLQKLTLSSNNLSPDKSGDETLVRGESSRSGPRYTTSAKGNAESSQGRQPKKQFTSGNGGKFPLPKNPKVDIPIFKGEGDILNWLYQLEHIFISMKPWKKIG